mgnify:CR=1 FL=1
MKEKQMTPDFQVRLFTSMILIRKFEEKIVALSQEPYRLPGMQILANGQEAVATVSRRSSSKEAWTMHMPFSSVCQL